MMIGYLRAVVFSIISVMREARPELLAKLPP